MPTYINLLRFTDRGAQALGKSAARAATFAKAAEKAGVQVVAQYWTVGAWDGVLILSAASEEPMLRCLANLSAAGNVRTQTLTAFDATQFAKTTGGRAR